MQHHTNYVLTFYIWFLSKLEKGNEMFYFLESHYNDFVRNSSKARVTRAIFSSRRQRNGSNFIALLARVIKMRVFHVLRGNAIVT